MRVSFKSKLSTAQVQQLCFFTQRINALDPLLDITVYIHTEEVVSLPDPFRLIGYPVIPSPLVEPGGIEICYLKTAPEYNVKQKIEAHRFYEKYHPELFEKEWRLNEDGNYW